MTRRIVSLPGASLALLGANLLLNVGLAWFISKQLPFAMLGVLVTAAEAYFWLRFAGGRPVPLARPEPRLDGLIQRSTAARRNSIRDEATGLYTRWYLEHRLDEEAARCRRYGLSMAVLVLRVGGGGVNLSDMSNDGWQTENLSIAHRTRQAVRNVDLCAALAPFEYAICLVHCNRDGAKSAIARLTADLEGCRCDVGLALYPDDNCEPPSLIALASGRVRSPETWFKD